MVSQFSMTRAVRIPKATIRAPIPVDARAILKSCRPPTRIFKALDKAIKACTKGNTNLVAPQKIPRPITIFFKPPNLLIKSTMAFIKLIVPSTTPAQSIFNNCCENLSTDCEILSKNSLLLATLPKDLATASDNFIKDGARAPPIFAFKTVALIPRRSK